MDRLSRERGAGRRSRRFAAGVCALVLPAISAASGAEERPLFVPAPSIDVENDGVRVFRPMPRAPSAKAVERPVANPYSVSCDEARQEVRAHGFRDVEDVRCGTSGHAFTGRRQGVRYIVRVSPKDGSMVTRKR